MDLIPRGGAREVGRSCYHLTAENRDYLVDCGLKQSHPTSYPDFTGLAPGQIDAVFLTNAHIDHTGALPLCEARGLLADEAPIIATRPANALAHILLWDSFKLHKMAMAERNQPQRYTEADVRRVLDRFDGVPYGSDTQYTIEYQFGDAGHLLGSAWLALTHNGQRVLFSGDLGGRSAHLSAIETPPAADTLVLESTYGDTHPPLVWRCSHGTG
jgi:Cft2 family RNA processing exonuclease